MTQCLVSSLFFVLGGGPFNWAGSSVNMLNRNVAEDVIPELDENLTTIISMRERENKPTVHDIFGTSVSNAPPASQPIDVPKPSSERESRQEPPLFTRSVTEPVVQIGDRARPRQLVVSTASVPLTTRPKFELFPVTPEGDDVDRATETTAATASVRLVQDEDQEIQGKRRSQSSESLAKKLAKTFGRSSGGDEKAEVHLLSDVSGAKDDDNSSS